MTPEPTHVTLVPHTHWDREWYLTVQRFGVRLLDIVSEVLERLDRPDDLPHFLLDGQVIVLEDYLAQRPADRERIRRHVSAGRLAIGPWYVLHDEFLTSGESSVRNLLVGARVCADLGGRQEVGYVPDAFGHVAQLPQILRRAGIDTFVFTRGSGDELSATGSEFRWVAPDGSEVLAIKLVGGYCNAGALGFDSDRDMFSGNTADPDRAIDRVRRALDRMAPLARSDRRLLTNGCDHLPPQQGLTEVMAAVRQANPGSHFEIGSLTTFLDGLRPAGPGLSVYAGELRGARTEHLLPGVLSTRMPIKQANERCECLVAAVLEPLASYLHFVCGAPYPGHAIDVLWKQLLANHPHDSICGCGTDLVHREMMTRFHGIVEVAEEYIATGLERLFPRTGSDGAHLAVFNPLPFPRRAIVEQTVVLSADIEVARIELVDRAGMPLPFTVVRADRVKRFWGPEWSRIIDAEAQREALELYEREHPGWFEVSGDRHDLFVTVQFDVTLPAIGVGVVSLRHRSPDRAPTQLPHRLAADETTIENEFIRVTMSPDGRLAIDDKRNDARYEGLNRLVDDEDAGDEYDYAHAEEPLSVSAVGLHGRVAIVEDTGFRATLETAFVWNLPEALTRDRTRRTEERIGCRVRIRASVTRGSPVVEIETAFDNDARDHRLRALFPTGLRATEIVSDGAFHLDHRPVDVAERPDWVQQPADAYPQREFSLVENGTRGVAVLNRGLPEVAPFRASDETVGIALTLLRCVGWLSRDDLSSRDRAVGPILPTPDAQCQGPHRFHYGVVPLCEPHRAADLKRLSAAYRVRPVAVQVQSAHGIAPDGGLFEIRPTGTHPAAAVSAVKRHADRDTLVVRLYDWSGQPSTQQLAFAQDLAGAWRTNLLEEREDELPVQSRRAIALDMTSFEVVTLEVAFA